MSDDVVVLRACDTTSAGRQCDTRMALSLTLVIVDATRWWAVYGKWTTNHGAADRAVLCHLAGKGPEREIDGTTSLSLLTYPLLAHNPPPCRRFLATGRHLALPVRHDLALM